MVLAPGQSANQTPVPATDAGSLAGIDPFAAMSEYLARQSRAPAGTARHLQEVLEKRVSEPDYRPELPDPEPGERWPPVLTTLLVLSVAAAFWGSLGWLFMAIFS